MSVFSSKIRMYDENNHFLRSHKLQPTFDGRVFYYRIECCKEYILETPQSHFKYPLVITPWPFKQHNDCTYHSRFEMYFKNKWEDGKHTFTALSFHKLAKCPCYGVLYLNHIQLYESFPYFTMDDHKLVLKIDSHNMMNLPK
jgi:hypothetical protein